MDLLPQDYKKFGKEQFWNEFFSKLQSESFEWYGEYSGLQDILRKYVKPIDNVLVVGCGNSTLSYDLYADGYQNIMSIDISGAVIKQMNDKYEKSCPDLTFKRMDVTQLEFDKDSFRVSLDKGTLDSIMVDQESETIEKVESMFDEIERVLKFGGRYICISLLQQHVLDVVLNWFVDKGWMIRIHRCFKAEENYRNSAVHFPVFVLVLTKVKKNPDISPVLELILQPDAAPKRVSSTNEIIENIKLVQYLAFMKHNLENCKKDEKVETDLCLELQCSQTKEIKYRLYVVNSKRSSLKFAVFIVPEGRETEWLFSTPDGRRKLSQSAKCERLVVVHLLRDVKYESLDVIKKDLSSCVMELAPPFLEDRPPFLSLGDDVGTRQVKMRGKSKASGDFIIEEVSTEESGIFRRLIFLSNPYLVQSEAKLKRVSEGDETLAIDHDYIACEHHSTMISGLALLDADITNPKILLIGLGGGCLAMYLHKHFHNCSIDAVELDDTIVPIAKEWFEVKTDDRLSLHIADGLVFMEDALGKEISYDMIFIDADCKDSSLGMSCPPPSFVEESALNIISKLIGNSGVLIINVVCRNETLKKQVFEKLKKSFVSIFHRKVPEEVSDIVYAFNTIRTGDFFTSSLSNAQKLTNLLEQQLLSSDDAFNMSEIIKSLKSLS